MFNQNEPVRFNHDEVSDVGLSGSLERMSPRISSGRLVISDDYLVSMRCEIFFFLLGFFRFYVLPTVRVTGEQGKYEQGVSEASQRESFDRDASYWLLGFFLYELETLNRLYIWSRIEYYFLGKTFKHIIGWFQTNIVLWQNIFLICFDIIHICRSLAVKKKKKKGSHCKITLSDYLLPLTINRRGESYIWLAKYKTTCP